MSVPAEPVRGEDPAPEREPLRHGDRATSGRLIDQAGEPRSARIESLRALSVLGVVVMHAIYWAAESGVQTEFGPVDRVVALAARPGPFLLFAGTGCMLYLPFARRYGGAASIDLRRYALNRAVRILPLYYTALVAVLVFQERGGTVRDWLLYATFTQNLAIFPNDQLNRVLWYLVVEVQFYLALPLLAAVIAALARGSARRAAAVLGVLGLASASFFGYAWHLDPTSDPALRFSLPSLFLFFAGGMAVAMVQVSWAHRRPSWVRGPLAAADTWLGAAVALWVLSITVGGRAESPAATAIYLALSALLLAGCVLPLRPGLLVRALDWRPLALVGVGSYSLYLWHDPILRALAGVPWVPPGWVGLLAVGLPVSLLAAFVSYAVIEAPFLRLRRCWSRSSAVPDTGRVPDRPADGPRASARRFR